jgi:hypothetical protein
MMYFGAQVFYFYVRIRYTFPSNYVGYSIFILVFEAIGSSNTVLQGLYLLRRKEYHYGAPQYHIACTPALSFDALHAMQLYQASCCSLVSPKGTTCGKVPFSRK